MSSPPETVGLDRASYLHIFVPGMVLVAAATTALLLVPDLAAWLHSLWGRLDGLPAKPVIAWLFAIVGGGVLALALGFLNCWLSRRLYDRSRTRIRALNSPLTGEILPYWAHPQGPYRSAFYTQLWEQITALAGNVQHLAVLKNAGTASPQVVRVDLDVAADLMYAWIQSHSAELSDPPHRRVEMWRERSDASIAFSTAFPISLLLIAVAGQARLVQSYGWVALLAILPVLAIAAAWLIYQWFVFRAVKEWANGQNTMSRAFWALHK